MTTRRHFISLTGGAVGLPAWPREAHAQSERMRLVGILISSADNPTYRSQLEAFFQVFYRLGWTEGSNVRFEIRWGANNRQKIAADAKELVDLKPDVILVGALNAVITLP